MNQYNNFCLCKKCQEKRYLKCSECGEPIIPEYELGYPSVRPGTYCINNK